MNNVRRRYAEMITAKAGIDDSRVARAFSSVERERFVGPGPWKFLTDNGYSNTNSIDPTLLYDDVVIGLVPEKLINNGEPSLHARCMAAVAPMPGDHVLHIGCGSGYYTAILAELVGPTGVVYALEIEPLLAKEALSNLESRKNVFVACRSGAEAPLPPCDVIYVSAGATEPPDAWIYSLKPNGRLIFPLTAGWDWGGMLLVTNTDLGLSAKFISRAMFVPCVGAQDPALETSLKLSFQRGDMDAVQTIRRIAGHAPDRSSWYNGKNWCLSTQPLTPAGVE